MNMPATALATEMNSSTDDLTSETGIDVDGFSFFYGSAQTLFDVSMQIPQGMVTALIGPSGCGKSTFLRSLNRMNDTIEGIKYQGDISIDGEDIFSRSTNLVHLRRKVGMVFQRSNPFPKSIYDNVAYGPRIHGTTDKNQLDDIVEDVLVKSHLWKEVKDRLKQSALRLSGGQQQRLCIARALAVRPKYLLMDEPASALDPASTAKIEELIAELRGEYTIIIVTHNMQQASRVSDKTAFLLNGDLVEFNETSVLFTKPEKKETEDYITGRFG